MSLCLRLRASIALILFAVFTCAAHAEKLGITSTPPGARVEINGVAVGTTPFEKDYPGGYFHKTKTAVGSRLGHPLVARLSFDGYSIKDIVLNVLHHFYPVNVAAPSSTSAPRNSPLKIEELSAKDDSS